MCRARLLEKVVGHTGLFVGVPTGLFVFGCLTWSVFTSVGPWCKTLNVCAFWCCMKLGWSERQDCMGLSTRPFRHVVCSSTPTCMDFWSGLFWAWPCWGRPSLGFGVSRCVSCRVVSWDVTTLCAVCVGVLCVCLGVGVGWLSSFRKLVHQSLNWRLSDKSVQFMTADWAMMVCLTSLMRSMVCKLLGSGSQARQTAWHIFFRPHEVKTGLWRLQKSKSSMNLKVAWLGDMLLNIKQVRPTAPNSCLACTKSSCLGSTFLPV